MKWIALFTAGWFCVLASYSYARYAPPPKRPHPVQRTEEVMLWRPSPELVLARKQAATLAKVYGITPENMNSDIFGRR